MHLGQVLLPLFDNSGRTFEQALYLDVKARFTEKFGGVTVYLRSPAEGAWQGPSGAKSHDEIGVLTEALNRMKTSMVQAIKMLES